MRRVASRLLLPFRVVYAAGILLLLALTAPVRRIRRRRRFSEPMFQVIKPWWPLMDRREGEGWTDVLGRIPPEIAHLYSLHHCYWQVENGGFWQFFWNPDGEFAPEARDGFRAIGMEGVAAIIQRAMDKIGDPYPRDRAARQARLGDPDERTDFEDENISFYRQTVPMGLMAHFMGASPGYISPANDYAIRSKDRLVRDVEREGQPKDL